MNVNALADALTIARIDCVKVGAASGAYDLLCCTRDAEFSKNYYLIMVRLIDSRLEG